MGPVFCILGCNLFVYITCLPPEVTEGSHMSLTSKQFDKVKGGEGEV